MSDVEGAPPASSRRVVELDPFAYFPTRRSILGGFGGTDGISDPGYAFHTQYQPSAPGPITFTVRLSGLVAESGNLLLRINAVVADFSQEAKLARSAQVPLAILVSHNGEVSLQVQARRGMAYALLGYVYNEAEVPVTGVTITLDRLDHSDTDADAYVEIEQTRFGAQAAKPVGLLIAEGVPSFRAPVSQVETQEQHRDREFARLAREIGLAGGGDAWPQAYVARVLEVYGMLEPGAQGLQLGGDDGRLATFVEKRGCPVTRRDPHGVDDAALPSDLGGPYDFLWSIGAASRLPGIADAAAWIEATLDLLNVGGMAVHCFRFARDATAATGDGMLRFTRGDVERLAFSLIANNHEAAQLAYAPPVREERPGEAWFGLVVRRGTF